MLFRRIRVDPKLVAKKGEIESCLRLQTLIWNHVLAPTVFYNLMSVTKTQGHYFFHSFQQSLLILTVFGTRRLQIIYFPQKLLGKDFIQFHNFQECEFFSFCFSRKEVWKVFEYFKWKFLPLQGIVPANILSLRKDNYIQQRKFGWINRGIRKLFLEPFQNMWHQIHSHKTYIICMMFILYMYLNHNLRSQQ